MWLLCGLGVCGRGATAGSGQPYSPGGWRARRARREQRERLGASAASKPRASAVRLR